MKVYPFESVDSSVVDVSEKTFRTWACRISTRITGLSVVGKPSTTGIYCKLPREIGFMLTKISFYVNLGLRFSGSHQQNCLINVDETDCPIQDPSLLSPRWYYHNMNRAKLSYDIAIKNFCGTVCWINESFQPVISTDLEIFSQQGLRSHLCDNEVV